jgi:hypothetical protein
MSTRHELSSRVPVAIEPRRDDVVAWRRSQLVRSGFPERLAARVARDGRYDLHRLIELSESGCPPELALRILAPLDQNEAA